MASTASTDALPESVGFIGLGAMGKPMAANLAKALPRGSQLHVHDAALAQVQELWTSFPDVVVRCWSAQEVAEASDVVITMLPEGAHVKSVYLDPTTGVIAALSSSPSRPKLFIDSSTIDTASSLHVKQELSAVSATASFYDAPVSGGVLGAENGTIAFFLGCSPSDRNIARLNALLQTMGAKVVPCGGPSLGLAAKLSNNYLSGIITIACAEAMDMGMRAGIDARVLAAVFAAGTAQNTICDVFNPVPGVCGRAPSSNGYRGGFRVQLMRKDIGLAVDMARTVGARNVLGASGLGVYVAASAAADCRDLDSRVVYRYLGGRENWEHDQEEQIAKAGETR
ncbi:NAD binding domain of 6-phosphogluconate dehydrogenase-domain-containing protein [Chaetomium strumarium]|uniref:3-hydroxyisobutyrate dehydrogenase n=1 Tax=Chaetomium strumarium TaxID=1170767 RepID=A0AAJ0H0J5_9PEZI|nr:NAD binding domain of 6-phosphogluconate dehydrogenase-domain-containing protein [Chaetomium strumarium]